VLKVERGFELTHYSSLDLGKQEADREKQRNAGMAGLENDVLHGAGRRAVGNRRASRGGGVKYRIGGLVTCGLRKQTSNISCISSNVRAQAQSPIDPAVM
jgi:hypothetical protein